MKKLLYINLIFATLLFSTGCKKGFLTDLAVNPNQPSQAPASLILPPILTGYASNVYFSASTDGLMDGVLFHQWFLFGFRQYRNLLCECCSPQTFGMAPTDILKNAQYMENTAATDPNGQYSVAVAKILKAWGFQAIVDAYGMAPYSQAFKGSGNFFPSYDDGQAIYDSSIADLDLAISIIQNAPSTASNLGIK